MMFLSLPSNSVNRPASAGGREKPRKPTIIIPPTQIIARHNVLVPKPVQTSLPSTTTTACVTPISSTSPPTSLPVGQMSTLEANTTENMVNTDLMAIAELFASLKRTVTTLHTTFDELGKQTEKMSNMAPAIKVEEQIKDKRVKLKQQIARHEKSMQDVRRLLESAIQGNLVERLKSQIYATIRENVGQEIYQRVQQELNNQIPDQLRREVHVHKRQILEVQTNLHNSDARRHNATLRSPSMTEPLRPLLRPLPSAAQSPAYVLHGSIPPFMSSNPTPTSAFPRPPAPTPIRSAIPTLMIPRESNQVFEMIPPTPSPLFPRDLKSLFSLGPDAARRLLRDYGIEGDTDAVRSPRTDEPRPKAAPKNTLGVVSESPSEPLSPTSADSESRENDINKFMAHIGVPFLMVPAPKSQIEPGRPQLHVVIPAGGPTLIATYNQK